MKTKYPSYTMGPLVLANLVLLEPYCSFVVVKLQRRASVTPLDKTTDDAIRELIKARIKREKFPKAKYPDAAKRLKEKLDEIK